MDIPHVPVLVEETLQVLITRTDGTYLDLNAGLAGHGEAICGQLDGEFRYVGIDLDPGALGVAAKRLTPFGDHVTLLQGDHRSFPSLLAGAGIEQVNGVLFDLGFSTAQLAPERGFAFDADGPLDMRYGREGRTAAELLASLDERALADAFATFGDLRGSRKLAGAIVRSREDEPLTTTRELGGLVQRVLRPHPTRRRKVFSQVFQTLRVLVNDEVGAFVEALAACERCVAPGGVVSVLAYESVTDRIAKRFFKPTDVPRDAFGNEVEPRKWELLTRRAVKASEEEVRRNPAARSARLRAGKRLGGDA